MSRTANLSNGNEALGFDACRFVARRSLQTRAAFDYMIIQSLTSYFSPRPGVSVTGTLRSARKMSTDAVTDGVIANTTPKANSANVADGYSTTKSGLPPRLRTPTNVNVSALFNVLSFPTHFRFPEVFPSDILVRNESRGNFK